jgi:hypothetical protein
MLPKMTHFRYEEKGCCGREPGQYFLMHVLGRENLLGISQGSSVAVGLSSGWKLDGRVNPVEYRSHVHCYMGNHWSHGVHSEEVAEGDEGIPAERLNDFRSTEFCISPILS